MSAAVSAILAAVAKAAVSYARRWAKKDARNRGEWRGTYRTNPATVEEAVANGYRADQPCIRVTVDSRYPLRFVHETGVEWAIGSGLVSDGGSIPSWAQMSLKKWFELDPKGGKLKAFLIHDEAYHNGGLWMRPDAKSKWQFVPVTRAVADMLLFQGLTACEWTTNADCCAIYAAVRSPLGRASWRRCQARMRKARERDAK